MPKGILLSHEKEGVCVSCREMNLEPATQCEVTQKEKDNWGILMHKRGIEKNSAGEPVSREGMETQMQRRTCGHSEGGRRWDRLSREP